jgi:nitrate reductase molybdenum cofactor assembly chaperone NarJ/NarW
VTAPTWRAVAARAASLLLRYPDDAVLDALPLLTAALAELPAKVGEPLHRVAARRTAGDPTGLRTEYVELFDFRRRCCLHLTYYTCGDTRRRGEALAGFAAAYKTCGVEIIGGELPDFLPAVLDLAAAEHTGWRLLRDNRIGLDLLAEALAREDTAYRYAVEAVRRLLPVARPADDAAAARLARTGPPTEQVGLEPYGLLDATGSGR